MIVVFTSKLTRLAGIAALLLMSTAGAQQAAVQSYDVELIIFKNSGVKASPEDWGMEAGTAGQHLAVTGEDGEEAEPTSPAPPAPPTSSVSFPALASGKFKLTAIEETLRRSRNYQPLAHFGWTQPGYARGEPRYLSIDGLVPAGAGVSGQIALSRGRYLHLTLELTYESADGGRMVLRQTRRMRSNERHYIDHPKFGVIAVITPSAGG